jgi:hypothetical protein
MHRILLAVSCLGFSACSSEPEPVELSVDLRTDYVPGMEFAEVRVDLPADGQFAEHTVEGGSYVEGRRVAELVSEPRDRRIVRLSLLEGDGSVLASREVIVDHGEDLAITVTISRDCAAVSCESPGSAVASCLGGRCVDPTCLTGEEPECEEPQCLADGDCASAVDCAEGICRGGTCLATDSGSCGAEGYCDLEEGCVYAEPPVVCPSAPLGETLVLAPSLALASPDSQVFRPRAGVDGMGLWLAYIGEDPAAELPRRMWASRIACDGTQTEAAMVDPEAPVQGIFAAAMGEEGLLVVWENGNAALFDVETGTQLAHRSDFATLDEGGAPFAGSESLGTLFPTASGFVLTGLRTVADDRAVFAQALDPFGEPTGPATELDVDAGLDPRAPTFIRRDDGAIAYAHRKAGDPFIHSFDGTETMLADDEWVPSLAWVDGELWFATSVRPGAFEDSALVLGRLRDGVITRYAIEAPPAGTSDYVPMLAPGEGSTSMLAWTRATGEPDVEGYDEVIRYRSVDFGGAEPILGPVVTIPQDGSGLTGGTDPRNENVHTAALVHLGADRFFVAWDEGWTRFRSFARFIELQAP